MAPKVVVISGCSSGIGLASALILAKDAQKRFKVYATMRNLRCHFSDVNYQRKSRILLLNNAGFSVFSIFECVSVELMKRMFEVNYFGTVRLIKAVIPFMKAKESGLIINNSSHAGVAGFPSAETYSSTKFAVEGLTESLAPTLRQFNIRCVLIEPGPVDTPLRTAVVPEGLDYSTVDQKSLLIEERVKSRWAEYWAQPQMVLSAEQVAEVVKEVILSENPNFRYQTNKQYCPDEIAAKLADIHGNKSVDIITKRFCDE